MNRMECVRDGNKPWPWVQLKNLVAREILLFQPKACRTPFGWGVGGMIRTEHVQASQCFLCPYGSGELETGQRGRPGQSALLVAEAQAAHGF